MKSYYEIIMQAEIFHDYFPVEVDNVCTSLRFFPTSECMSRLNDAHLIFKNTINGFVIVGEKKNIGTDAAPILVPLINIEKETQFHFFITEIENDFINITDTDPKLFQGGKKYIFRNTDVHTALINGNIATVNIFNNAPITDVVTIATANFLGPVVIPENPVKLVLRDVDNRYVSEAAVPRDTGGNISAERLLLSKNPFSEGIYMLQQVNAANTITSSKKYFITADAFRQDINGVFAINYNTILSAQASREIHLTVDLTSRSVRWIYNVDIEKYEDAAEFPLRVKPADLNLDASAASPSIATAFAKTIVQVSANPADWFINDKVRFRSINAVPMHEKSYEKIRLLNSVLPQPVIVDSLPNPDPLLIRESAIFPNTYEVEMFLKVK